MKICVLTLPKIFRPVSETYLFFLFGLRFRQQTTGESTVTDHIPYTYREEEKLTAWNTKNVRGSRGGEQGVWTP